jgi:hypothetical protein
MAPGKKDDGRQDEPVQPPGVVEPDQIGASARLRADAVAPPRRVLDRFHVILAVGVDDPMFFDDAQMASLDGET